MSRQIDRRAFLRRGAAAAGVLAVGPGLLAACSTDETGADAKAGGGSSSRSGGTLRAAFVGGGAAESLDFFNGPSALDLVRARAWHGTLGNLDPSGPDGVRYGVLKGIDISDDLDLSGLVGEDGIGETDYFAFRCFKNGNLHLIFKRPDLVRRLNQIAGGKRLRGERP